jgi:hypothetical protein
VWERGVAMAPPARALWVLSAAAPNLTSEAIAAMSVGRRDARMLDLRERLFGSRLNGVVDCLVCGERLEVDFDVADIRAEAGTDAEQELTLVKYGYELFFRAPTVGDLFELMNEAGGGSNGSMGAGDARSRLLDRCLTGARFKGREKKAGELPARVIDAVVERMAEADPQADVRFAMVCPACDHRWQAAFDIGSYLWSEIHDWAVRMLGEIHLLASAYGWRESDILAMNPLRRQVYIEMARG